MTDPLAAMAEMAARRQQLLGGKPKRSPHAKTHAEYDIQCAFFELAWLHRKTIPEIERIFHCPNGAHLPRKKLNGAWVCTEGQRLRKAGMRPGVPDVLWPLPRAGYLGWAAEFKAPGGRLSPEQADWLNWLERIGWKVDTFYDAETAWASARAYYALGT